jgi:redox-sensitive bicupin YhaK (pirin superfamily)
VHQDVELYRTELAAGAKVELPLGKGRGAWIQVMKGSLTLNGKTLSTGDGAAVENEEKLVLEGANGAGPADALVFDLG